MLRMLLSHRLSFIRGHDAPSFLPNEGNIKVCSSGPNYGIFISNMFLTHAWHVIAQTSIPLHGLAKSLIFILKYIIRQFAESFI